MNEQIKKQYKCLIEDVKENYKQSKDTNQNPQNDNVFLEWCDECDEINLWTYWQGRGNFNARIMLVGQDWGCPDDKLSKEVMMNIKKMKAGKDVSYMDGNKTPTDLRLTELFKVIGYDIKKNNKDLFFTNLALGYRNKGFSGKLNKCWLKNDAIYFKKLVELIKPSVILCLGKETYEIATSEVAGENVRISSLSSALDGQSNFIDVAVNGTYPVRIYALAHCGALGTMNRKRYCTQKNNKLDGLELQKSDWKAIGNYIEKLPKN